MRSGLTGTLPPTNTNEGLIAAQRIRAEHPGVGVLVLSHHVETRQAIRLLQDTPQRVGYLLKDRVSEISEFTDAIQRIAHGGSVIDPKWWPTCCAAAPTAPSPA